MRAVASGSSLSMGLLAGFRFLSGEVRNQSIVPLKAPAIFLEVGPDLTSKEKVPPVGQTKGPERPQNTCLEKRAGAPTLPYH